MLYANKTDANRGIILRVLHDNVTRLYVSSGTTGLTPIEKLARVHALLFYQSIRLFDGDITLGQQAQNDFKLLDTWIGDLLHHRDNLNDCEYMDTATLRNNPPQSWEVRIGSPPFPSHSPSLFFSNTIYQRWIFAESLRRTVLIGYALKSLSDLLRGLNKPSKSTSAIIVDITAY